MKTQCASARKRIGGLCASLCFPLSSLPLSLWLLFACMVLCFSLSLPLSLSLCVCHFRCVCVCFYLYVCVCVCVCVCCVGVTGMMNDWTEFVDLWKTVGLRLSSTSLWWKVPLAYVTWRVLLFVGWALLFSREGLLCPPPHTPTRVLLPPWNRSVC